MNTDPIELVVDAKARIGESPLWSPEEAALYWIDVKAPALFRTGVETHATESWHLPSDIGGYALRAGGSGAVVALRTGIFALDFASAGLMELCEAPFDPRTHRFNEGDCDPRGRLWLGTMFDPQPGMDAEPRKGHLYSFTMEAGLLQHDSDALLHNGFAWSRDGRTMYLAHSYEGRIYAYDFDVEQGRLGDRRTFAEVPKDVGIPDGGALDVEGFYWCAIHQGGRLRRYAPDGHLDREIRLPVDNPTMPAFAGRDLGDLYVTSATHGKPGKPHEGGLFRVAGLQRPICVV